MLLPWRPLLPPRPAIFSFARKSPLKIPLSPGPLIPQRDLVDEEICPDYNSATFYPANPGQVLARRFQLLVKIGWGSQSTVWLAQDISSNNADDALHELEIERHIAQQNPEHRGHVILRTCLDHFEVKGPEGRHMCLVYEVMREPVWIFKRRFVDREIPLPLAKAYIYFLLAGLDYLHSECKVVHTDLKLGNILMSFENAKVLSEFVKCQEPMQRKIDGHTGRTVYRCHNDFGPLSAKELKNMVPKIADFGLAASLGKQSTHNGMVGEQFGVYPIQPDHYRAPEVILGCGWDCKADIWNFGVLLWNFLGNQELFQQVLNTKGQYDAKSHLAEMVALLGPPPKALLAKSKAIGPFFNEEGWSEASVVRQLY
ncbi:hypothetical protein N7468_002860 [Penicillium chermesinum]|uniref:non-specific serine/threonine protein kinase n=1 Tax=Penicillium chermesinum TaxID=63820 RepID=A0A9W9PKR7_9EURO|nr:uncharacterized protein N7468_002860 [Penicillium chermesinum]KAJ5247877.1 hypothetical protein N7468_002860 [Penicillium chermesinum]